MHESYMQPHSYFYLPTGSFHTAQYPTFCSCLQQPWQNLSLPTGLSVLFQQHRSMHSAASPDTLCSSLRATATATCHLVCRGLSSMSQHTSSVCRMVLALAGCCQPSWRCEANVLPDSTLGTAPGQGRNARVNALAKLLREFRAEPVCKDTAEALSKWVVRLPEAGQPRNEHLTHCLLYTSPSPRD